MNEKSNPMPMMYKTIPAVAELNKVPGFDPLKFLRHKVSRKTNEEMLQLELPYQKLWFRLRHPQGRMKLTTLRITEQLAIMEARVYLDRSDAEPISSYISQHSAEEGTDYVQAAQDEALSAALSDAGFGLQFADVAVDSTGKVFGSSIPLSGTAPIQQPMPNAAQRPVEAPGAALRQSGGEVHARPERAPQNAVEGRNAPARPAPIQKPAAKPVQNEQPPVSPVQPVVQQMVAEEKENMDTLPAGKVEENADYMVVVPDGILDIITEGRALHHCAGSSDRYWDRIERRESFVMFLRKTADPFHAYYTLEVEPDGTVRQKRTEYDRQKKDIEQATEFLQKWQRVITARLTESDKALAAESRILREKEFIQLKKDRVIIHTGHLAGRLLADVLMADLMENTDSIQSPALAAAA